MKRTFQKQILRTALASLCLLVTVAPASETLAQDFQYYLPPDLRIPDGHVPEFETPSDKGACPQGYRAHMLGKRLKCMKCRPGYEYRDYYRRGRCVKCSGAESLEVVEGKTMCLTCPGGSSLIGLCCPPTLTCACPDGKVFIKSEKGWRCARR